MPQPIRVDPQELAGGAAVVGDCADQVAAGHGAAASVVDAAQPGLVGRSALAVVATAQRWREDTARLQRVLASHADAIAAAAKTYEATEAANRGAVAALSPRDPSTS